MYEWLVLVHIVGVLGFMFTHGVSAAMSLRLRHERNPDRIRVMLQISSSSLAVFYVSILLLLGGGVWAGFNGHWWGQGWIWVALGVFLANMVFMYAVPARYYKKIREVMTIEESGARRSGRTSSRPCSGRTCRPRSSAWGGLARVHRLPDGHQALLRGRTMYGTIAVGTDGSLTAAAAEAVALRLAKASGGRVLFVSVHGWAR